MLIPKSVTARFACISAAIVTACLVYPSAAQQVHLRPAEQPATPATPTTLANLSELERQRLIVQITEISNQTANEKSWFEQDLRPLIIRVGLNIDSNGIAFDMEGRLSHEAGFDDMADLHRAIENRILMLEGTGEINVFEWTYGGRPLDEILRNVEPCTADSASIGDLNELGRFRIRRYCRRDDVEKGPIEYLVTVQDFWGARTEPKTFRLTCLPKTRRKGR